jgi:hypothetical protein
LQLHPRFARSITIVSIASLIYSLLSSGLITFLLNINSTPSPPTSRYITASPFLRFLLKEDTSSRGVELIGVLATKMLLFIDNKGKSTNIGNPYCNGLSIIMPPP